MFHEEVPELKRLLSLVVAISLLAAGCAGNADETQATVGVAEAPATGEPFESEDLPEQADEGGGRQVGAIASGPSVPQVTETDQTPSAELPPIPDVAPLSVSGPALDALRAIAALTEHRSDMPWANGIPPRCSVPVPDREIERTAVLLEGDGVAACLTSGDYQYGAGLASNEIDWDNDFQFDQVPTTRRWADGALQSGCNDDDFCVAVWTGGAVSVFVLAPTQRGGEEFLAANIASILEWVPTINTDGIERDVFRTLGSIIEDAGVDRYYPE